MQDGVFRGAPNAIAQTSDGYIWIGTESELLRFDGVRFMRWASPDGTKLPSPEIDSLLGARDGSLWIGTRAGLSHWVNGRIVNYSNPKAVIPAIVEDHDGTVWFIHIPSLDHPGSLCRVTGASVRCYGKADGIPIFASGNSLDIDSLGNLWIGLDTALVRWKSGTSDVYRPSGLKSNEGTQGVTGFASDADGSLWAGMALSGSDLGLQHFVQSTWKPFIVPELDGRTVDVSALFMDSHNALWIGTSKQGLYRIFGGRVEHFQVADGLSGNAVFRFCEDREGNIWAATSRGMDKFSDLQVATYSSREGLGTDEVDSVLAARDGTVWIGGQGALDALRNGKVSSIRAGKGLPGNQVTSLLEDHAGRLWVGIDNALTIYENGRFRRVDKPDKSPIGLIVDMAEDTDNNIWLETGSPSRTLIRIHDEKVQEQFPAPQLPSGRQVAADPAGGIWIGTRNGDLIHYQNGHTELIAFKHDQESNVEHLLVNADGSVLGATSFGLIGWRQGTKQTLTVRNGLPCNGIFAMITDHAGALWLSTQCGLVEMAGTELQKWWQQPESVLTVRVFDEFDGVQLGWAPFQKAAKTPDGRLWFVNDYVLQMIDPDRLYQNALPPPVHVEGVIADRNSFSTVQGLRLPPRTRDLEIDYTALSFTVPQRVRFRYKLEGHDVDWQDPGTRRQAFYNDLGPGMFTFHVLACNNDGFWSETGVRFTFNVERAWFQTLWFRVLWITTVCLLIVGVYRVRVHYIAKAISARFDERLDERTRMALELHDTFLQTVQGSKMVADDALDPAADQERMRRALERLSVWLERAVMEGRAALHALRVSTTERNHLTEFLDRSAKEHCQPTEISVALTVIGDARDLHPIVRVEITRIAEEAIRNTSLHSNASQLSIELRYARDLSLSLKDNGVGIDPEIVEAGKAGHFGIQGMKERSARIRARITIKSTLNAGTEVTLRVPGDVVYRREKRSLVDKLRDLKFWPRR